MIKVEEITIKEFRGIRNLTLKPQGKNFAVCGPNGTGKSGIVDAIEFALTGSISRLSGAGTGGLSVLKHGPHVDYRDNPEKAEVLLTVSIPSLSTTATIQRTVKGVKNPTITPETAEIREVFSKIQEHPEFVLSRREIIKYILAGPTDRATSVQALLRLEKITSLRSALKKVANATEKEKKPLISSAEIAANRLIEGMGITRVSTREVLEQANIRRATLGLPKIELLEQTTSLSDGVTTATPSATTAVTKEVAKAGLEAAHLRWLDVSSTDFQTAISEVVDLTVELSSLPKEAAENELLLQSSLNLFDGSSCPVCDVEWGAEDFKLHIQKKLAEFAEITSKKKVLQSKLDPLAVKLESFLADLKSNLMNAPKLSELPEMVAMKEVGKLINQATIIIRRGIISELPTAFELLRGLSVGEVNDEFTVMSSKISIMPEASQTEAAQGYLIIAQERLEAFRIAKNAEKRGVDDAKRAADVYERFEAHTTAALEKIYQDVQEYFKTLYIEVNDDEAAFVAQLKPSSGALDFLVDFYGKGFFPPGAYHSEGHQDGMGLCLYLALMTHLLKGGFSFAVLDDVLMSIDAGHRRAVSKLLIDKFPSTQFIMTTHDDIWLRHMGSTGLIGKNGKVHFRKWTVETGPTEWDYGDVWNEIDTELSKGHVSHASSLLRNYLEAVGHSICDGLRARVEFRADGQYGMGQLMPAAIGGLKSNLKLAKASAQSWKNEAEFKRIQDMDDKFTLAIKATDMDRWQVNAAVHYNPWATLSVKDFAPVVKSYKALIRVFQCEHCNGFLFVDPVMGEMNTLRCGCNRTSINLKDQVKAKTA